MPGKQDGPSLIIYGPPNPPPRIAKMRIFFTLEPIYEKLVIIFSPCYKLLTALTICNPGFDVRAPQDPPNMNKIAQMHIYSH